MHFLYMNLILRLPLQMYINPSLVKNAINLEDTDQQKWKTVDYFVENMMKVQGSVSVSIE